MLSRNMVSIRNLILLLLLVNAVVGTDEHEPEDVSEEVVVKEEVAEEVKPVKPSPRVKINDGELKGKILSSLSGRAIYTFLGIPYAKPPIGELRFSHPRRPEPWDGVRDATKDREICAQLRFPERTYDGVEDCLFINVFTTLLPEDPDVDINTLHDVVVVIHDGGFQFNSGNVDAYLPDHLLEHDIVMVTFNYRLGVLGFLSTGDEWAPGNYGLKDQVEALSWVRRNIVQFGGNPMSVTLLGSQAGGSSAHLHLLSPLSRDRFQGAISMSGTALSPWALVDSDLATKRAFKLAKIAGCRKKDIESTEAIVKCLRKRFPTDLVEAAPKVMEWGNDYSTPFAPVVEPRLPNMRPFLPKHPVELMNKMIKGPDGRWEKSWLIGVTSDEALPIALQVMVFPYIAENLNTNPEKYLPLFLGMEIADEEKRNAVGKKIWDRYFKDERLTYTNLNKLADLMSDYNVFHGVSKSVKLQSANSEAAIFVYRFSFDRRADSMSLGVPQGDDVEGIFPNVMATKRRAYGEKEMKVVTMLTQMVANFAKHGDPTPEGSVGSDILWPIAAGDDFKFVDINKKMKIDDTFYPKRIQFWDEITEMLNAPIKHDEL